MKNQRFTLDEIRERLKAIDGYISGYEKNQPGVKGPVTLDSLVEEFKELEKQLIQLQPMIKNLDTSQASLVTKQVLVQSMSLMQTLVLYISALSSYV